MPWPQSGVGVSALRNSPERRVAAVERIGRITRQNRDVVALGWIEVNLAGIQRADLLCAVGPANAVAESHTAGVRPAERSGRIRRTVVPCSRSPRPACSWCGSWCRRWGCSLRATVGQPAGGGFVVHLGSM